MTNTNAHNTYANNHINVESSDKLMQMLYEGILRFNTQAKRAIKDNDIEKKAYWLDKSNSIFLELIHMIDYEQGDVAHYLHGLYFYQLEQLTLANLHSDITKIDGVNYVVKGLIEAWKDTVNVA